MRVLIEIMGEPGLMTLAGAKQGTWVYTDRRTGIVSEAKAYKDNPDRLKRDWLDMGENHREEEGCSVREITHPGWFLEVETLNDLAQLLRRSGGSHIEVVSSPEDLLKLADY